MCATCGCSGDQQHGHADHSHGHEHEHGHGHVKAPFAPKRINLEQRVLAKNDLAAEENRLWLRRREIVALNLLSSPGAGKTTLLEKTVTRLHPEWPVSVIEGDQETSRDADRIRAAGCAAVQLNTGAGCHLDAEMVRRGLNALDPGERSLLLIENVGNLVCPALFDLGEAAKVVIVSVTEGDDKPLKYPHMFRASSLMVINKLDLLPHVPFDLNRCIENARQVNPSLEVLSVSALRGDGMEQWLGWLQAHRTHSRDGDRLLFPREK